MSSTDRCPQCGALVLPDENFCPKCGAKLEHAEPAQAERPLPEGVVLNARGAQAVPEPAAEERPLPADVVLNARGAQPIPEEAEPIPAAGGVPATIGELQAFCARNGMPLEKMRFFIGVDYRQPRAFGIYRDGDSCVVYKNKDDGSRAVRYNGPDEAYAVKELYDKLLDECHKRDIWPDGKPKDYEARRRREKRSSMLLMVLVALLIATVAAFAVFTESRAHRHDGYYRFDDAGMYYHYGDSWYYDDDYYDWVEVYDVPYDDYEQYGGYYVGEDYDDAWGYSDFRESDAWEDIQAESNTSSSDYDSWDSGGTDWSSDW